MCKPNALNEFYFYIMYIKYRYHNYYNSTIHSVHTDGTRLKRGKGKKKAGLSLECDFSTRHFGHVSSSLDASFNVKSLIIIYVDPFCRRVDWPSPSTSTCNCNLLTSNPQQNSKKFSVDWFYMPLFAIEFSIWFE